jgi:putative transposase
MLCSTIKYKIKQIGGVFVEVPTKKVKPSQTCPKCGHQYKKTLDIRVHKCTVCNYIQNRGIAAAELMLYWAKGNLPGLGTSLVDADVTGSTSRTSKKAGDLEATRTNEASKTQSYRGECRNSPLNEVGVSSSFINCIAHLD